MSTGRAKQRGPSSIWILSAIFGLGIGCASVNEEVSGDEGARGAQPSSSCQQLLALLSDENKQPLLPKYGAGGSCWTGGRSEAKGCEAQCASQVNDLLRSAVKRSREPS
jgi:hypothetical protein